MRKLKLNIDYLCNLLESKDHIIDRLNLTDDQKTRLKDFFKKYPNYESKIDWNRKDLTFEDFESLLANEGKSKTQAKKQGLEGIIEGKDYKVLEQTDDYIAYQPLTYLGSKTIASNRVPPVKDKGAQWCTAYQKTDEYWNRYTISYGYRFCYVCTANTKLALVLYPNLTKHTCFSFEDTQMPCPPKYRHLYQALMNKDDQESYRKLADRRRQQAEKRKEKENEQKELINGLKEFWKGKKTIYLPQNITMKRLIKTIEIPEGAEDIAQCAFEDCSQLRQVTLPGSLTSIDYWAFHNCHSLKEVVIPESVTSIGNYAFQNCWYLKSVQLPKHLKSIGNQTFANCNSLINMTLPEGIEVIPYACFYDCASMQWIRLPKSIKKIERFAFWGPYTATDPVIYYAGTPEDWAKIEFMFEGPVTKSNEIIFEGK